MASLVVLCGLVFTLLASAAARATEQGTLIHFPAKLTDDWAPAEAAAEEAAAALGAGTWLRFDDLWHEQNWEPFAPAGPARMRRIVALCKRLNLRPLMDVVPHPWPGSEWAAPWQPSRDWGDPDPRMFPWIAVRYAQTVGEYRAALAEVGIAEADAALQFGNEPAAGHPGGNAALSAGTWSGAALWAECNRAADYGKLHVLAPALSMQDHPVDVAERERRTALVDAATWAAPVTAWALHNRVYRPNLAGDAYAAEYVARLRERARTVLDLGWPKGEGDRDEGVWVTEAYVAVGDAGGDRAAAVKAVAEKVRRGVPGVAVLIWYRWHPASPPGEVEWQYDPASKAALAEVARVPQADR